MAKFKIFPEDLFKTANESSNNFKSSPLASVPEEEAFDKYSLLGTPVYSNFEIPAGEYTDLSGNKIQFRGIRIDSCLIDISQERNIIRTAISGVNGTIKQFISDGDYVINLSGIIFGISNEGNSGMEMANIIGVPEEEIRKFKAICSVPREIEVVSKFLDFFDISTVVISSPSFSEIEGKRNQISFTLNMYSDKPIELKGEALFGIAKKWIFKKSFGKLISIIYYREAFEFIAV